MSYASSRGWPVRTPASALSTARYSASMAPLPSAEARHSWSPERDDDRPRLRALLPDVTVQRASWRESAGRFGHRVTSGGRGRAMARLAAGARPGSARREVAFVAAPQLGAGLPDRVLERVGEGRRGRRDDVGVAAHRRPGPGAVHRIDDDPGPGRGRRAAVEDAHLVVDQVDVVEPRVERAERLAQGGVERVDRAVAVGGGVERLAVDLDLDGRLGQQLAAVALLDQAGVVDDPERRGVVGGMAADEQLEARLGALERQPVRLELLDQRGQLARVDDALELEAELLGTDRGVGAPAELGHDQAPGVADRGRVDVLVAPLDLGHGRPVDAALVGERGPPDVRLVVVRGLSWRSPRPSGTGRSGRPGRRRRTARAAWGVLSARLARMLTMLALPRARRSR